MIIIEARTQKKRVGVNIITVYGTDAEIANEFAAAMAAVVRHMEPINGGTHEDIIRQITENAIRALPNTREVIKYDAGKRN